MSTRKTRARKRDHGIDQEVFAIMAIHEWKTVSVLNGIPLTAPAEGPHWFLPVFATREKAEAWKLNPDQAVIAMLISKKDEVKS